MSKKFKVNYRLLSIIGGSIILLGLTGWYIFKQNQELNNYRSKSLELQQKAIKLEEEKLELAKQTPIPTVEPTITPTPKPIVVATPKPEKKVVPIQVNTPGGFSTLYCYEDKANEVSNKAGKLMAQMNYIKSTANLAYYMSEEEKTKMQNDLFSASEQFNQAKKDFCP